ncbi:hypothetical protein KUF97_09605 [Streptococcus equi subsp. zooepidemicus]|uniref:hypothetical protein n=1 Tax=Streptococcus equi TaxID=1336 RepID=UPI001E2B29AB|nr:hypothetical protein [Streptococcus equi]MCD3414360.1 hypothetical protein [Streptococcus equi subsp. zooepidemicus]HEL0787348.1 hypothetical protein [Streptococcus equi subsp. zooepidemicus]
MARKKTEETTEEVVEKQEVTEETTEEVVETVSVKKSVTLTKDGVYFTLSDPIMISAFENQGYEVEE